MDGNHEELTDCVAALKRAAILLRGITIRHVFDGGIDMIEAAGLDPWCINEGRATGDEPLHCGFIDSAIAGAEDALSAIDGKEKLNG